MNWLIVDRTGNVVLETNDLDQAWSICETHAVCGISLTVVSEREKVQ